MKIRGRIRDQERGATLVEGAIVIGVLFMLIGAIFDIGVGIYRYTLLTYATNHVARTATTLSGRGICNNALVDETKLAANDYVIKTFGVEASNAAHGIHFAEPLFRTNLATNETVLEVEGLYEYQCFFCTALRTRLTLSATGHSVIQDNCS